MLLTIGKILICLISVGIILVIMMQKPKESGAGSQFGGSTFLNTARNQTREGKLDRMTKILCIVFAVASFVLVLIQNYISTPAA